MIVDEGLKEVRDLSGRKLSMWMQFVRDGGLLISRVPHKYMYLHFQVLIWDGITLNPIASKEDGILSVRQVVFHIDGVPSNNLND